MRYVRNVSALFLALACGACVTVGPGPLSGNNLPGRWKALQVNGRQLPLVSERHEGTVACLDVVSRMEMRLVRGGAGSLVTTMGSDCATPGSGQPTQAADIPTSDVTDHFRWRVPRKGVIEVSFDGSEWQSMSFSFPNLGDLHTRMNLPDGSAETAVWQRQY